MHPFYKLTAVAVATLALVACDDTSVSTTAPSPSNATADTTQSGASTATIRVLHASPDAPAVAIDLNGNTAIESLDYAASTGFAEIAAGSYDVAVNGLLPGGAKATVISVDDLDLAAGSATTIAAIGKVANIAPLVIASSAATPTASQVSLTVSHAAPDVPPVELYLLGPNDTVDLGTPGASVAFGNTLDLGALTAGSVRIVAAAGGAVAFDSGVVDLAPFAGNPLTVLAIATDTAAERAASPVSLLVATPSSHIELRDTRTQAAARVTHLSPDARAAAHGPVEVWARAGDSEDFVQLVDAISYTETLPGGENYLAVAPESYRFDVAPDTNTPGDSVFTSDRVALTQGEDYTVLAIGRVTNTDAKNAFRLSALTGAGRSIATQATLRVSHGAPAAGAVDVYLSPAGTVAVDQLGGQTPTLRGFSFGDTTDSLALSPGAYDVRVVAGGAVAINAEGVALDAGSVWTAVARGPLEGVHAAPQDFGLVLIER